MWKSNMNRLPRICVVALLMMLSAACTPVSLSTRSEPPQVLFGDLFVAVQTAGIYPDSKTFADAIPKSLPSQIMARYAQEQPSSTEDLRRFVAAHFILPVEGSSPALRQRSDVETHIDTLWPLLTRHTPVISANTSMLSLPRPYVVPGGRFREMYYWDSYFTLLGLAQSGRDDLVEDMVRNFAYLIDTFGHVPNGTRTYYLSRSQPPLFFAMVGLLQNDASGAAYVPYLPQLRREYEFWMRGELDTPRGTARGRVVVMNDGVVLNRYWDDSDRPRDESYREDIELAKRSTRDPARLFRDIRAAAESGWDFSSRWFEDGRSMETIRTTRIVPVDLNSLLFGLEQAILAGCKRSDDLACADEFAARAAKRQAAIDRYLWDASGGVYRDYDLDDNQWVPRLSAATLYPLFVGLPSAQQAAAVASATARELLKAGGIVATPLTTGQQWDAPNGWAPLQWIAISGLRRYDQATLADSIACRWVSSVNRVYMDSGKLMEKYDVVDIHRRGGGGEYPLQDGFGWTNGVMRKLLALYPAYSARSTPEQCATLPMHAAMP